MKLSCWQQNRARNWFVHLKKTKKKPWRTSRQEFRDYVFDSSAHISLRFLLSSSRRHFLSKEHRTSAKERSGWVSLMVRSRRKKSCCLDCVMVGLPTLSWIIARDLGVGPRLANSRKLLKIWGWTLGGRSGHNAIESTLQRRGTDLYHLDITRNSRR